MPWGVVSPTDRKPVTTKTLTGLLPWGGRAHPFASPAPPPPPRNRTEMANNQISCQLGTWLGWARPFANSPAPPTPKLTPACCLGGVGSPVRPSAPPHTETPVGSFLLPLSNHFGIFVFGSDQELATKWPYNCSTKLMLSAFCTICRA